MTYSNVKLPDAPARIHLVGIKGQAMAGLAQLLQSHGYTVTGSDVAETFPTDAVLRKLNIPVAENFSAENITKDISLVVFSTAYNEAHIELQQAGKLGIPTLPHPLLQKELLSFSANRVCVSGTHGKTTTSAMLARILEDATLDPTALIGAPVAGWGTNARPGGDNIFVLEADEYQNKLQYYDATHVILTSVDYDHPDVFPTKADYQQVFKDFVARIPQSGYFLYFNEDPDVVALTNLVNAEGESYGLKEGSDWLIANIKFAEGGTEFEVIHKRNSLGVFKISYSGIHYALDATASIAMAIKLGASVDQCKKTLRSYQGTARRQEKIGMYNEALVFDDYAHHPAEIQPTIEAFRKAYPGQRLIVVFEAHTYTRTEALLPDFATALSKADLVYIPPIFGSAREKKGNITPEFFAGAINDVGGKAESRESLSEILNALRKNVKPGDVVVTMGAGDVWQVAKKLVNNV